MENDITNGKKMAVIGTKSYTLLRNIVVPEKQAAKEYDLLLEAFQLIWT